jgi:hypothetical protein
MMPVNTQKLLALYAVLPLSLGLLFIDWISGGSLSQSLPANPEYWPIWIYIFGMPHVFASFILLADKQYWQEFQSKLVVSAIIMLMIPPVFTLFFDFYFLFFLFTALIVYHTVAQQFGIALIVSKIRPDRWHFVHTFAGSFIGVILYTYMYADARLDFIMPFKSYLLDIACGLSILVGAITVRQYLRANTPAGRLFLLCNLAMLFTMFILFTYGFQLLSIVIGRIIHEFTAWYIYSVHDHNRNSVVHHNLIFKSLPMIPARYAGFILAFALGIAFIFLSEQFDHFLALLIVSFSLYHYWIEGFIWKGSSGPKQQVSFK